MCVMIASYCWGKMPKVHNLSDPSFQVLWWGRITPGSKLSCKADHFKDREQQHKEAPGFHFTSPKIITCLSPTCTGLPPKDSTTSQVLKVYGWLNLRKRTSVSTKVTRSLSESGHFSKCSNCEPNPKASQQSRDFSNRKSDTGASLKILQETENGETLTLERWPWATGLFKHDCFCLPLSLHQAEAVAQRVEEDKVTKQY